MKNIKLAIGVVLAVIWGAVFLVMPAHASDDALSAAQNGSGETSTKMDGKAKARAGFTISFNGGGSTEGNFDHNGMMQDIFNAEQTPYYFKK